MRGFSKVMLAGNLTADPEAKETKTGRQLATFSLATNRAWKNAAGEQVARTDFHRVVAWGKLADTVKQYLKRGQPVLLQGRLNNSSYEGSDGSKKYSTEVVLEDFNFLSPPKKGEKMRPVEEVAELV